MCVVNLSFSVDVMKTNTEFATTDIDLNLVPIYINKYTFVTDSYNERKKNQKEVTSASHLLW